MLSEKKYNALKTKYARFAKLNSKAGYPILDDMQIPVYTVNNEIAYQKLDKELDSNIHYAQDRLDGLHEVEYLSQFKE